MKYPMCNVSFIIQFLLNFYLDNMIPTFTMDFSWKKWPKFAKFCIFCFKLLGFHESSKNIIRFILSLSYLICRQIWFKLFYGWLSFWLHHKILKTSHVFTIFWEYHWNQWMFGRNWRWIPYYQQYQKFYLFY